MYSDLAAKAKGTVQFIDTSPWFCAESLCPAFVGTTPMFVDGGHMTDAYSRFLGPVIRADLLLR